MSKYIRTLAATIVAITILFASTCAASQASRRTPVVEAFEKNKEAVVSISSKHVERVQDDIFWGFEDFPFHFGRPRLQVVPSLGSGFIIDKRGYIVTNAHVIRRAVEITIDMADGSAYQAKIIAADKSVDLALLKIDADKEFLTVEMGFSDDLMIGETVLAVGNPFGYQQTLTDGILSAIHRDVQLSEGVYMPNFLQISAPINPGNSGGPLININGQVIGINTAIRKAAQGIGFAIPIDQLRTNLSRMIDIETIRRVDLGLEISDIRNENGIAGVRIDAVREGSAAGKARFETGDRITAINSEKIHSSIEFYLNMLECDVGKDVTFTVKNNDRIRNVKLTLRERPEPDGAVLAQRLFGLELKTLTPNLSRNFQIAGETGDIVVWSVERGSPAHKANIEPRDIILGINGEKIKSLKDIGLKLEMVKEGDTVIISHQRYRQIWNRIVLEQFNASLKARTDGLSARTTKNLFDI